MEQDRKPGNKPTYGHLIYNKGGNSIKWRIDSLCNNIAGKTWQKLKSEHSLKPYTKINSKWIKDLSIWVDTKKLLEENIEHSTK